MSNLTYTTTGTNNYTIFWTQDLNGGGMLFGPEYPSIIQSLYPNRVFKHALEWCAGPGFIGFNLLDHGICERVSFIDIYEPAINMVEQSKVFNNLQERVQTYLSGKISNLPSSCRFDLVVGNPPHYDRITNNDQSRIGDDVNWHIHNEFYSNLANYLTDDAVVLIQENEDGSIPSYFTDMIKKGNLNFVESIKSPNYYTTAPMLIYYMHITKGVQ